MNCFAVNKAVLITGFLVILFTEKNCAQTDSSAFTLEPVIDEFYEISASEAENSSIYNYFYRLSEDKTEINKADIYALIKIPFMDFATAKSIINYRNEYGYIFSPGELTSIRGIDTTIIRYIAPFITVNYKTIGSNEDVRPDEGRAYFRSRWSEDVQKSKGFMENKFEGSRLRSYQKTGGSFGKNYSFAIIAEKDAGELSYFDHTSFYFAVKETGIINKLIIGNYIAGFAQGLALGGLYPQYINFDAAANFNRSDNGFIPFSGAAENLFLRGTAGSFNYKNFNCAVFISNNKCDAVSDTNGIITSIPATGLHRTESENRNKKILRETVYGGSIEYKFPFVKTGLLFYQSDFSKSLGLRNNTRGNIFNIGSLFYNAVWDDVSIAGEAACDGRNFSHINSISALASKGVAFVLSVRDYAEDFFSPHSGAFGKQGADNQFGVFAGVKIKTSIGAINFSCDNSKTKIPSSADVFPDKENTILLGYSSGKILPAEIEIRSSLNSRENTVNGLSMTERTGRFKISVKKQLAADIILREQLYYTNRSLKPSGKSESGFAIMQDIDCSISRSLRISARAVWFNTASFNSAVYTFEKDMPGIMLNQALYGRGVKCFVMLAFVPAENTRLTLKYSSLYKPDFESIGSGYDEIEGNTLGRLSFQADISL